MNKVNSLKAARIAAASLVVLCACAARADDSWDGHVEAVEKSGGTLDISLTSDTVVIQRGCDVRPDSGSGDNSFGKDYAAGNTGVYLLQSGAFEIQRDWLVRGAYNQFRQYGGDFRVKNLKVGQGSIPREFVFGGSGVADLGWAGSGGNNPQIMSDAVIAVNDGASLRQGAGVGLVMTDASRHRIWAFNGGTAECQLFGKDAPLYTPTNDFVVFNGGTRIDTSTTSSDNLRIFGVDPHVRICEGGGELRIAGGTYSQQAGVDFTVPTNVIKSVALTPAAMSNIVDGVAKLWDVPPAVEFIDSTGTNAAAVVDYDFDNKVITNITILSCGEGYSSNARAQFRYVAGEENRLLETPLVCTVGDARGGDFTYSTTNLSSKIYIYATNWWHGATIVDMNMAGLDDSAISDTAGACLRVDSNARFFNTERVVMKSGLFHSIDSANIHKVFPDIKHLVLYGGYLGRFYDSYIDEITVGGVVRLWARGTNKYPTYLHLNAGGTMYADASAITNGVTPALIAYEGLRDISHVDFTKSNAKIAVTNWTALARGVNTVVLDLSLANPKGTPTVVKSDEGAVWWDATEKKLYARRSGGWIILLK